MHAGAHSHWSNAARSMMQSSGGNQSMETGARGVGELVGQWIAEVRAGFATPHLVDAFEARSLAATDFMEQVRTLLAVGSIHPAAPNRSRRRRTGDRAALGHPGACPRITSRSLAWLLRDSARLRPFTEPGPATAPSSRGTSPTQRQPSQLRRARRVRRPPTQCKTGEQPRQCRGESSHRCV